MRRSTRPLWPTSDELRFCRWSSVTTEPAVAAPAVTRTTGIVEQLLDACVRRGVSDLHISPGLPPMGRLEGSLVRMADSVWGADATEAFCRALTGDRHWGELQEVETADFGIGHASGDRCRANVLRQRSGYAAVLRRISDALLSFEDTWDIRR